VGLSFSPTIPACAEHSGFQTLGTASIRCLLSSIATVRLRTLRVSIRSSRTTAVSALPDGHLGRFSSEEGRLPVRETLSNRSRFLSKPLRRATRPVETFSRLLDFNAFPRRSFHRRTRRCIFNLHSPDYTAYGFPHFSPLLSKSAALRRGFPCHDIARQNFGCHTLRRFRFRKPNHEGVCCRLLLPNTI
jgi:hypothetical protein